MASASSSSASTATDSAPKDPFASPPSSRRSSVHWQLNETNQATTTAGTPHVTPAAAPVPPLPNLHDTVANATAFAAVRKAPIFTTGSISSTPISLSAAGSSASIAQPSTPFIHTPNGTNPFTLRPGSLAFAANATGAQVGPGTPGAARRPTPRMRSHLLEGEPGKMEKPWVEKPKPRAKVSYWLVYLMVSVGVAVSAIQCYFTYKNVLLDRQPLCMVFDEEFDGSESDVFGQNNQGGKFMREVDMSGFGNGEFEMTTGSSNNSYVKNGMLYIAPTLTQDAIGVDALYDGMVYNISGCTFNETHANDGYIITGDGTAAGSRKFDYDGYARSCSAVSNATSGSIINPVQSARINTMFSTGGSIRYGKVEIRAKMPTGDWLWPAIWMLPKESVYGDWPRSGEIDIVESRGNGLRYTARGNNYVQGALNWGPTPQLNMVQKSYSWWSDKRKGFNEGFHTYSLEWTDKFLRVSVDSRLHTLLTIPFNKPFFNKGDFPATIVNGTTGSLMPLENPWTNATDANSAPFDQEFYLIMNVAVGGTGGWFPEGQGNKPWLNGAANAMRDFARNQNLWYPTWPTNLDDRAMVVDYVRMWKHC